MDESKRDLDDDLDAGLAAAFGDTVEPGTSILKRIERLTGVTSQILLHDSPDEESPLTHVHRLTRDEEAAEDDSRYQVAGEIAKGGVGVVYKCRDRDLGRDVAVKVLRKVHAGNPEVFHRFVEEAQIGGQLQHPGIVPVYSLGLQPDGRPSFAMKLVKGRTLAAALKERKSPAEDRRMLLTTFERICQTMAYAHARGVIHRDLKPSNVMLGAFGEVLVVDWGFGKVLGRPEREEPEAEKTVVTTVRSEHEGSASIAGSVMGTPAYMPPEQALGHVADLDESTDVFSLGAILTEILTGSPPYVGESRDLLVLASQAKLDDALERLEECDADPEVAALARRCLSPLRKDRPTNATEVAAEMGRLLTQAEERAHAAELDAVKERSRVRQARIHAESERKAKKLTIGIATAALVLIACGGLFFFQQDAKARTLAAAARPKVEQALEEVSRLSGQGEWNEALAEAKRAEHLAADLDDATRARVAAVATETLAAGNSAAAEQVQLEKDRTLLAALEELRLLWIDLSTNDYQTLDRNFSAAFRDYGLAIETLSTEEVAETVRARGKAFAIEIAAVLDEWAWVQRQIEEGGESTDHLLAAAAACDLDSSQNRIRDLQQREDDDAVMALTSGPETLELPVRSLILLSRYLKERDRRTERVEFLERVVQRHPGDAFVHHHLAAAYQDTKQREGALRHYSAVLALRPKSGMAHNNLGSVLANYYRDLVGAERYLRAAIRLDASVPMFHLNLGIVLQNDRRLEAAAQAYEEAIRLNPDHLDAQVHLHSVRYLAGDRGRAIEGLEQLVARHPEYPRGHARLGMGMLWRGDQARAKKLFDTAFELDPTCLDALWGRGVCLRIEGRHRDAVQLHRAALAINDRRPMDHSALGMALAATGEESEARKAYERALELDPFHAATYTNLGNLHYAKREFDQAAELHRKAIQLDPSLLEPHMNLMQILLIQARLREAVEVLRGLGEARPRDPLGPYHEGYVLYILGELDEANAALQEAIHRDAELAAAHWLLGMTLRLQGRFEEAVESLRRGLACPSARQRQRLLTVRTPPQAALAKAEPQADLARRLPDIFDGTGEPPDASELRDLAEVCSIQERNPEALGFLERVLAADPTLADDPDFHRLGGCVAVAAAMETEGPRRTDFLRKARVWLQRTLDLWKKQYSASVLPQLERYCWEDPSLEGVRGEEAIRKLPEGEQEEWRAFWRRVEALSPEYQGGN